VRYSNQKLLADIQRKREEMLDIAKNSGLNSDMTIRCSQELDNLILIYQYMLIENQRHRNNIKKRKQVILLSKTPVEAFTS
jgi:stage 0 sporulation regulatory protein